MVVVGGGNTAIDVARECAQLGAEEVTMVYRRGAAEMSGYAHEIDGGAEGGRAPAARTRSPVAVAARRGRRS